MATAYLIQHATEARGYHAKRASLHVVAVDAKFLFALDLRERAITKLFIVRVPLGYFILAQVVARPRCAPGA